MLHVSNYQRTMSIPVVTMFLEVEEFGLSYLPQHRNKYMQRPVHGSFQTARKTARSESL